MQADKQKAAVIESHLHLVINIAREFENKGADIEDIITIGTIGLIKGVNTYDPTEETELAAHLSNCIKTELTEYFRKHKRKRRKAS